LFLTFEGFSALIVLNLFLIYNQKYYYTGLLNKLYEVFVWLAELRASSCTWII